MNDNNCSHAKDQLLEEIQDGMTSDGFEIFLEKYSECKEELLPFYDTIQGLDGIERVGPSDSMDTKFYAMLETELEAKAESKPAAKLVMKRNRNWYKSLAIAASIFMVGALAGFYFFGDKGDQQSVLMAAQDGVQGEESNSDQVILAGNSSMNRLEDISEMMKAPELSDKIIDALNKSLINDPNVNVRLTAIEAMIHYADNPKVRENLIKAIPYQDSPIIQMTLAEVMLALEEGNSKDEWQELFKSGKMEDDVKQQVEETLAPVLKL